MVTDLFNLHHLSTNQQEDADARDQYRIRKHDVPWRQMQRHLLFRWSIIEQIMKLSPHYKHHNVSINFFFFFFFFLFWDKMSQAILISVFITKLEAFKKRKRKKKKKRYFFFLVSRNYCFAGIMHQQTSLSLEQSRFFNALFRFQWRAHKILATTSPPFSYNFSRCRCRTKVKKIWTLSKKVTQNPNSPIPFPSRLNIKSWNQSTGLKLTIIIQAPTNILWI